MRFLTLIFVLLSGAASAEPLPEFEALVAQCRASFDARPAVEVARVDTMNTWVKRAWAKTNIVYDVRKTDSLVTPFTAYIETTEIVVTKKAADEDGAKALELSPDDRPAKFVKITNFAYQERKWVATGGSISIASKSGDGFASPSVFEKSKKDVLASTGPLANCLTLNR